MVIIINSSAKEVKITFNHEKGETLEDLIETGIKFFEGNPDFIESMEIVLSEARTHIRKKKKDESP